MIYSIGEVVRYRNLIKQLVIRDLRLRYERSLLGFLWSLLNPLVMIAVYTFFFSHVVRIGIEHYPVFLVTVLLPWNFLAKGLQSVAALPYQNGYLLNCSAFPAESLVLSGLISNFVDFCLEIAILLLLLTLFGMPVWPGILVVPLVMLIHFLFTAGVTLFTAVSYVYYRDTQYIVGILSMVWLYLTPVFYSASHVPGRYQALYGLNPMVHIAEVFRTSLYAGSLPNCPSFVTAGLVAAGSLVLGWWFFNRHKGSFAELL